ncbi:MAG: hypothetical protein ACLTR4_13920 [Gallintestinimicrobium sp.]
MLYKQDEKMQFSAGDSFFVPCSGEKSGRRETAS